MTSLPEEPGAAVAILYRQVDQVEKLTTESRQSNYVRLKIFADAGRRYGTVEIPFDKSYGDVSSIRARTVHPNGSIVNFDGKVYETSILKAKGYHYTAKVFSIPDVQVGDILEYQYFYTATERHDGSFYQLHNSIWFLNMELFTRLAKFSMDAYVRNGMRIAYSWPAGLPAGVKPPEEQGDGIIRMEARNIPAIVPEDYMPPMGEIRQRVEFNYHDGFLESDPDKFWKDYGRKEYARMESFIGNSNFLNRITSETVPLNDPSESNLRKLYERVQKFHNLSYEVQLTLQQLEQQNAHLEEIWNSGTGFGTKLNWLFLGMARTAGFAAYPLPVANRKRSFFNKSRMNARELGFSAVLVFTER